VGHLLLLLSHLDPFCAGSDLLEPGGGGLNVLDAGENGCPGRSPRGGLGGDHGKEEGGFRVGLDSEIRLRRRRS
jgi:hypothetical protein